MSDDKKKFPKSLLSVTKEPGKWQPSKGKKILADNHSTLAKYYRKISSPLITHISKVQMSTLVSFKVLLHFPS